MLGVTSAQRLGALAARRLQFLPPSSRLASSHGGDLKTRSTAEIHEHHVPDPGPPATYDDLPIPYKPFKEEYDKQQRQFNGVFIGGAAFFAVSLAYGLYNNIWSLDAGAPPKVFQERHKEIAKYKAEATKEAKGKGGDVGGGGSVPVVEEKSSGWSIFGGSKKPVAEVPKGVPVTKLDPTPLPKHVPYLIVGAGTAAYSAFRAVRGGDAEAKVLLIGDEDHYPYMRPPLSKELWFTDDKNVARDLKFKQWNGKERGIFYEEEEFYVPVNKLMDTAHGGVAIARYFDVSKR